MTAKRTPRRRHPDRLVAPDEHETPGAVVCTMILAPLDRLREAMDAKWGMDRLVGLYPPEPGAHVTAEHHDAYRRVPENYGRAVEALHVALDRNDVDEVRTWAERARKLIAVMDRECDRAGVQRPEPDTLETELDGRRVIIVADTRDAAEVERRNPGARVVTAREAAVAVERMRNGLAALGEIRRQWPGVELEPTAKAKREELEDDLPF